MVIIFARSGQKCVQPGCSCCGFSRCLVLLVEGIVGGENTAASRHFTTRVRGVGGSLGEFTKNGSVPNFYNDFLSLPPLIIISGSKYCSRFIRFISFWSSEVKGLITSFLLGLTFTNIAVE